MTASALERLRASSPDAVALAALASIAARVDRAVLRTLRIELLSDIGADATAEADLWMSTLVARRSTNDVVLRTDVLEALRGELAASTKLGAARALVRALHAGSSPLLQLEEELIALGLTGGTEAEIERRLGEAVAAMRGHTDRSADIAGWALTALPRLPARVRSTAAAWSLAFAAETESGYAVTLGVTAPTSGIVVDSRVPKADLCVAREGNHLMLGASEGASMQVPATTPRVVMVAVGSGPSRVVTIEPGKIETLAIEPGDVVLTNLLGERWRVDAAEEPAPASLDSHSENGRWVLVEGTEGFDLPPYQHALAIALGKALASAGFSLLTLGRPGVSHVAAQGFASALATAGYSSCNYRLAHLVHEGSHPAFSEGGRILPILGDEPITNSILSRANAILALGRSQLTAELAAAVQGANTPFAAVLEETKGSSLSPPLPKEWTSETITWFTAGIVGMLHSALGIEPEAPGFGDLVHLAATTLDLVYPGDYEGTLATLKERAPSVVDAATARRLIVDPYRPSYRLLGYCALRDSLSEVPGKLVVAMTVERRAIQMFWETRPLVSALETLIGAVWRADAEHTRALAACFTIIRGELDAEPRIDPRNECKELLRRAQTSSLRSREILTSEWTSRAVDLSVMAAKYATIRRTMTSGEPRTQEMVALVNEIASRFRQEPMAREASVWFTGGNPGQRILALSLLLAAPDPEAYWIVEQAIGTAQSAFEQTIALRVAEAVLDQLDPTKLEALRKVLEGQRGGPPGIITEGQRRWTLSATLLDRIKARISSNPSQLA